MPSTSRWVFTQLGGDRRTLELADHAAPHGRPRQKAVVEDEIEIREDEVYYSGEVPPTRHVFGRRFTPWDLDGRFSDVYGGAGFAKAKAEECKLFVAEQQLVQITWADVISAKGLIKRFSPGREAIGEVVWDMTILIDSDDLIPVPRVVAEVVVPATDYAAVWDALLPAQEILEARERAAEAFERRQPMQLRADVFTTLEGLVASLNTVSAAALAVSEQIDTLASAPFALLARFRAGLRQVSTAVGNLRNTYDQFEVNLALETERAQEAQRFMDLQARWDAGAIEALREIQRLDRATELAQAGQIRGAIRANDGDTWESLSRRAYGDGTRADDIREANGVEPGQDPEANVQYLVPR
jgi:hypothetical protein